MSHCQDKGLSPLFLLVPVMECIWYDPELIRRATNMTSPVLLQLGIFQTKMTFRIR